MSDAAVAAPAKKAAPKKKTTKPNAPAAHPKYSEMIAQAISTLKERGGSSRQAILKYIVKNFKVGDEKSANSHLKLALRAGVKKGSLKQAKGSGASGSFKLGETKKAAKPKKAKKPKAAKKSPKKAKKPAKAKKPKTDKPKKAKSPKKAAKPKAKAAAKPKKSPAKRAAKPKVRKLLPRPRGQPLRSRLLSKLL